MVEEEQGPHARHRWAALEGMGAVAIGATVGIALRHPPLAFSHWLHLFYAAGHLLAIGALTSAILAVGRWLPKGKEALAFGVAALASSVVIPTEIAPFAARVGSGMEPPITLAGTLIAGALLVAGWKGGRTLARWPWLAPILAAGAALVEPFILPGLYAGLHLYGLVLAGLFAGGARSTAPTKNGAVGKGAVASALLVALLSLILPAPAAVRSALARDGGVLLTLLPWPPTRVATAVQPSDDLWLRPVHKREPTPPSEVSRPAAPVVVLVTIDALRADLMGRDDVRLPNLRALAAEGVELTNAHAPGSMTVNTLSTVFSGTHFSQQRWDQGTRWRHLWPLNDRTPRFPALLSEAGVHTVNYPASDWLVADFGIVRGFAEERYQRPAEPREGSVRWNHSDDLLPRMIATLESLGPDQPTFLYAHWMDPHSPYTRGGVAETEELGYLAEVEHVDEHLGELRDALRRPGLEERAYLIVTADHGEAFGERGRFQHAYGLYEELLHVPLVVVGPALEPRETDELVTLTDLGPTILDVFGQPTPPSMVGQSLLPLLHGDPVELTRPVLAESRLMRSLLTPGGIKVIRDLRRGTLEVYDLQTDPGETDDRVGELTPAMEAAVATLDRFFEVHQLREDGYEPPYRP